MTVQCVKTFLCYRSHPEAPCKNPDVTTYVPAVKLQRHERQGQEGEPLSLAGCYPTSSFIYRSYLKRQKKKKVVTYEAGHMTSFSGRQTSTSMG